MLSFLSFIKGNLLYYKRQATQPVTLLTLIFVIVVVLLNYLDMWVGTVLEFDRAKISDGQFWRIFTGNFVHFGTYHTLMNLASVSLIGLCLFWLFPVRFWLVLLLLVPLMDGLGLYYLSADIEVYRGYSGAVYGLAIVGLVLNWRLNPVLASLVMLGLFGKLVYERLPTYDVNFLVDKIGVPVAVDAHLWGGISGVLLSVPIWFCVRQLNKLPVESPNSKA